jgi:hypothetical protein
MTIIQAVFGGLLVLVLLAAASWTVVRQRALLAEARSSADGEAVHLRHRAWRRLTCGLLMAVLGVMLAGALLFLEAPAEELGPLAEEDPESRGFVRLYLWYWVIFLMLLMALVLVAGVDRWAVWRHGRQEMKKLQQERRDMIARETAQMRRHRNGQPP